MLHSGTVTTLACRCVVVARVTTIAALGLQLKHFDEPVFWYLYQHWTKHQVPGYYILPRRLVVVAVALRQLAFAQDMPCPQRFHGFAPK